MFWQLIYGLVSLVDKIIDRFIPTRREYAVNSYIDKAKDVIRKQRDREQRQKKADDEAKAILRDNKPVDSG